jgi:hypothetical protein
LALSRADYIESVLSGLDGVDWAEGPFTLIADADVFPADGPDLQIAPARVQRHTIPDTAIVVRGAFYTTGGMKREYMLEVLDRGHGMYVRYTHDELAPLLDMLPSGATVHSHQCSETGSLCEVQPAAGPIEGIDSGCWMALSGSWRNRTVARK